MPKRNRPLSPHLTIYKPQITSMLSIMHRMTGVGLCLGTVLLVGLLASLMLGVEAFEAYRYFMNNWFMQLVFAGFVVALVFHFFNGIRHLFWDIGKGYEMTIVNATGWLVMVATVGLSALILWSVL